MLGAARDWYARATSEWSDWPLDRLLDLKRSRGARISVVVPAKNESATISGVVTGLRQALVEDAALIDELVVMDSDSTDDTAAVAAAAGAVVHATRAVAPGEGSRRGKGEALWKSLFVTSGDLLVFVDADLTHWGPHFVTGLLGPLLDDPAVELVKGYYDRILDEGDGRKSGVGGRVTELTARPLLNLLRPELAAVVQPLAGEWAIRRSTFERLEVPVGYGVEIATLLDVAAAGGLAAVAQVDLGRRAHIHQNEHDLGLMAAEVLAAAARRLGLPVSGRSLFQFDRAADDGWRERPVPERERPAAVSVPAYRARTG